MVTFGTGSGVLRGVDVVSAYATSHAWEAGAIERVRRRSRIEAVGPGVVRVEHRGQTHRYQCQQEMTVGRSKRVERIVHREVDGQRPALDALFAAVPIQRPH